MGRTLLIIGSIIAIGVIGTVASFLSKRISGTKIITAICRVALFDKQAIKAWTNNIDVPEYDSTFHFYIIKITEAELSKFKFTQSDASKLSNLEEKKLLALVLTDGEQNTIKSTLYICEEIESSIDSQLKQDVTELKLTF